MNPMTRDRSPFPGMDPHLEHPSRWRDVHSSLVTYLRDDLQAGLPARYYARMEDRVYVDAAPYGIAPDVRVIDRGGPGGGGGSTSTDRAVLVEVVPAETEERFIEIRDTESGGEVVTIVEVLSPANKRRGGPGAEAYRARQAEILASATSLVEIDLLRGGEHVACVPREALANHEPFHYLAVVRRAAAPTRREAYPTSLRSKLPRIAVPLRPPDADVPVDLQSLVERAYGRGAYGKTIDYAKPAEPPLEAQDDAWARALA